VRGDTRIHGTTKRHVAAMFAERRPALRPLPVEPLLWGVSPALPFWIAGAIGLAGVLVFVVTVEERHAG